jgi:hypothetical protein
MKRSALILTMFLTTLLTAATAAAQSTPQAEKPKSPGDEMAMYEEMAKPVPEHARLTALAGKWKMSMKMWLDPTKEPMTWTGTSTITPILGGRFIEIDANVEGPMPMESLTVAGFDRRTNEYTLVGFDTMGTYWISAAGKWNDAQKAMTLHGSYLQPPANTNQSYRFVWTLASSNEHRMTLYFAVPGAADVLVAETVYTRAGKS